MNSEYSPTTLVTGATGRLGTAVCRALLDRGHSVRATDRRFVAGFPVRVELGDLCDELFVYRVTDGCDSVVHLGNHPNPWVGLSPQRLLSENVTMNANVFFASLHLGVRCLIFASSIQVMLNLAGRRRPAPSAIPYLPLDGDAPSAPGLNPYAQSKEIAERAMRLLCEAHPELSATSLRLPMLAPDLWLEQMTSTPRLPLGWLSFGECLAYLQLPDAGTLVVRVLEQRLPGYHQYLPAATVQVNNYPIAEMIRDHYAHVRLRRPVEEITNLIDLSLLERELGWQPELRVSVEVER
jgi:nucleoside-diphosphate-sugar epimerase